MVQVVAMGMIFFDSDKAGQSEQWALDLVQGLKDHTKNMAPNAARIAVGTAGERASHFGAYRVEADGSLVELSSWHLDEIDAVKEGKPIKSGTKLTLDNTTPWEAGRADGYPLGYNVNHVNKFWRAQLAGATTEPDKNNPDWLEVSTA